MFKMRRIWQDREGFTLIELIIVLSVASILTLVAINLLGSQRNTDANTKTKTLLRDASALIVSWPNDSNNTALGNWSALTNYMQLTDPTNNNTPNWQVLSPDSAITWQYQTNTNGTVDGGGTCTWPQESTPTTVCVTTYSDTRGGYSGGTLYGATFTARSTTGTYYCAGEQNADITPTDGTPIRGYEEASLTTGTQTDCNTLGLAGSSKWSVVGWLDTSKLGA
jgi:prepilin-type N-terminal cleavage/methylation domain-containing protein